MNHDRLGRLLGELQRLAPRGEYSDVYFFHDDICPCRGKGGQLPDCICNPWVELRGIRYEVSPRGLLIPMRRV